MSIDLDDPVEYVGLNYRIDNALQEDIGWEFQDIWNEMFSYYETTGWYDNYWVDMYLDQHIFHIELKGEHHYSDPYNPDVVTEIAWWYRWGDSLFECAFDADSKPSDSFING